MLDLMLRTAETDGRYFRRVLAARDIPQLILNIETLFLPLNTPLLSVSANLDTRIQMSKGFESK